MHASKFTTIKVWSIPTRLMHWTLVASFVTAMLTRDSEIMRDIHVNAGYVAACVLLIRWIYGFFVRDFSAFRRFPPNPRAGLIYLRDLIRWRAQRYIGHNPAGALAVYGMLILGVLTCASGYMVFNDIGIAVLGIESDVIGDWHNTLAYSWFGLICLHITGVLVGSLSHRENLPLAMITGKKKRRLVPNHQVAKPVQQPLPDYVRRQYIEEAAYYIAESRGFESGQDWDHWLEAEKDVDERLYHAIVLPNETKPTGTD